MTQNQDLGLIAATASIRDAIAAIDRSPHKIALVVDDEQRLLGTVTDGDVRRALLAGDTVDTPAADIMYRTPIVAPVGGPLDEAARQAEQRAIREVPLIDDDGRVVDIHTVTDNRPGDRLENPVVLMAGGLGLRLRPLTENAPKPLLAVGAKPLLETIVEQLLAQGFRRLYFAVRYKAEMVEAHFGDGSRWDAEFHYLREPEPLGTAGAVGLLPETPTQPIIVMNADLLTKVDLRHLLEFHAQSSVAATMAVRAYEFEIPYGVVSTEGFYITSIEEKPVQQFFVNAGIYALAPEVLERIAPGQHLDMPDLFESLIADGESAAAFAIREYWIDIGQMEDYRQANNDYRDEFE